MGNGLRLCQIRAESVLAILVTFTVALALLFLIENPYGNYLSILSHTNEGLVSLNNDTERFLHNFHSHKGDIDVGLSSDNATKVDTELNVGERNLYGRSTVQNEWHVSSEVLRTGLQSGALNLSSGKECVMLGVDERLGINFSSNKFPEASSCTKHVIEERHIDHPTLNHKLGSGKSVLPVATNYSSVYNNEHKFKESDLITEGSTNSSVMSINTLLRKKRGKSMSIFQMNFLLQNNFVRMKSKRPRQSSRHDRVLQRAKFQIENAPMQRNEVHSALFRNYSMFKRSYELMEATLKVYVYREGEKPIFHQPYMRGIYASEGWFMKLIERNRQFVVKDPKRAHLFYIPFSSVKLRNALNSSDFVNRKDLENHLKKYVETIAGKYLFWNRTGGADHFLVACHDWAPRFTRMVFGSSIRVLCNSNIAGGFRIGKDVSLPVTYIRSSENPSRDIGGNPPSNRSILAFFAGGMHGYVRPILLQYWHNKESDMKILGPMPRDIEGKAKYREFMKSSKYCICAKGYEVHTPRVMESIYYECVPVIISDNYVPPFFQVFNWESFTLFILENDIPKLRDILLSISEHRYNMMQSRIKMVRRYFLWHKTPERYDLFHMILHSVWYNRVFQLSD